MSSKWHKAQDILNVIKMAQGTLNVIKMAQGTGHTECHQNGTM